MEVAVAPLGELSQDDDDETYVELDYPSGVVTFNANEPFLLRIPYPDSLAK